MFNLLTSDAKVLQGVQLTRGIHFYQNKLILSLEVK